MGYRIVYGGSTPVIKRRNGTGRRLRTLIAVSFLLFSMTVRMIWPEGTEMLRTVFLPVDLSVTEQAFSDLVYDIRHGYSLEESITVFCKRIIDENS